MGLRLAAAVVAAALIAGGAVAALIAIRDDAGPQVGGIEAEALLGPTAALFGDRIGAEVRVVLDRRVVDPDSVVVSTDFGALSAPAATAPQRERVGNAVVLRYRYALFCLRDECRAHDAPRTIEFPPALVRYTMRDGSRRTRQLELPAVTIGSRLAGVSAGIASWRVRDDPLPPASYRIAPAAFAAVGFALALVLFIAGTVVVARSARTLLRRPAADELAGLTPLERALRLMRLALAGGAAADVRRALDRLGRELARAGHRDLASEARRLAWQRPGPDAAEAGGLVLRVSESTGAAA